MKKVIALAAAGAISLCMMGCSSGSSTEAPKSQEPAAQEQKAPEVKAETKAFDGSAFSDTGAGIMYLRTAGGTSEGGKVPELAIKADTQMMQIEMDTDGMDGSVCIVYIDGLENTTMNAGERTQQTITLQSDALKSGNHTVELVKMGGATPAIYKKAEYKVA